MRQVKSDTDALPTTDPNDKPSDATTGLKDAQTCTVPPEKIAGLTLAMKRTTAGERVVSVVVEIVGCANLVPDKQGGSSSKIDPRIKVKLAKSGKTVHKTKPVKNTINPSYSRLSHSAFVIDGMPVENLYKSDGLLFKVMHAKQELGYLHLPPNQLLQANRENMVLEWIHPQTMLPGAGTVIVRIFPMQPYDYDYCKSKGLGYFVDYQVAKDHPHEEDLNGKPEQPDINTAMDTDDSLEDAKGQVPPMSPRTNKVKKEKSSWKIYFFGSGKKNNSKSKKQSTNSKDTPATTTTPREETPTIAMTPTNDEEDEEIPTAASSSQQESQSSTTNLNGSISKVQVLPGAELGAEQIEAALQANAPTTGERLQEGAPNCTREDPYEMGEEAGKECLDLHAPKQQSDECGKDCCFALFGW